LGGGLVARAVSMARYFISQPAAIFQPLEPPRLFGPHDSMRVLWELAGPAAFLTVGVIKNGCGNKVKSWDF